MKRGDVKHGRVIANQSDGDKAKTFKQLCEDFIKNAEVRGLSEWTIKTYNYHRGSPSGDPPVRLVQPRKASHLQWRTYAICSTYCIGEFMRWCYNFV